MVLEGSSPSGQSKGMEVRKLIAHSLVHKQEAKRDIENGVKSFKTSKPTLVTHLLQQDHTCKSYPNTSTNWEPGIHTCKLM